MLRFTGLTAIRFLPGFEPSADLFQEKAAPTVLLATGALAQRVLDAGCTGVQFRHPLWFAPGFEEIVKTRNGAARVIWDKAGRGYRLEPVPLQEADAGPDGSVEQTST